MLRIRTASPHQKFNAIERLSIALLCLLGFTALPIAQIATSTAARESSAPVEESPVGCSEASLVSRVEWCGSPHESTRSGNSACQPKRRNAFVPPCLLLSGHRWSNGLMAPLLV